MIISNIERTEYKIRNRHSTTVKVSYRADVYCPACGKPERFPLCYIDLANESEDCLMRKLSKCGPWVCQTCGVAFGLSSFAKRAVLIVYYKHRREFPKRK